MKEKIPFLTKLTTVVTKLRLRKILKLLIPPPIFNFLIDLRENSELKLLTKIVLSDLLERKATLTALELKTIELFSNKNSFLSPEFRKVWLKNTSELGCYYDFNGAKLCYCENEEYDRLINACFAETFLMHCFYDDNYSKEILEKFHNLAEDPYSYKDGNFDVTVKQGDVVIDAGAWIGDFSAYAALKGATAYAFEPVSETYNYLEKTAKLNNNKIIPIKQGIGAEETEIEMVVDKVNRMGGTIISEKGNEIRYRSQPEKIGITTLDKFVDKNNIKKVDFIKADIEGAERDMLKGASRVLKEFAPKLAICTYHLFDDPQVLRGLILEANPKYRIVQLHNKLFACIDNYT